LCSGAFYLEFCYGDVSVLKVKGNKNKVGCEEAVVGEKGLEIFGHLV